MVRAISGPSYSDKLIKIHAAMFNRAQNPGHLSEPLYPWWINVNKAWFSTYFRGVYDQFGWSPTYEKDDPLL